MDHGCEPETGFRVTFPGPFTHHEVAVHGWSVPFLKASLGAEDRLRLILDERRMIELSTHEAERFIPFLADAIAVALGYGAHPRENMKFLPERAPHASPRRVVRVEALPDEEAA
jgi:hypothetical protein